MEAMCRFVWTRAVRQLDVPGKGASGVAAYEVNITVEWNQGDRVREVSLNSILLETGGAS